MSAPRADGQAVRLQDGRILAMGGHGATAQAEIFDPATGNWTPTAPMHTKRSTFSATLLFSGQVLVAGGRDDATDTYWATAELYDPRTATWTATGSMQTARILHTATLLPDGTVLVTGGAAKGQSHLATAEHYDPRSGSWTPAGRMHVARSRHTATLLPDGRVLVAGGDTPVAEVFHPASGLWTLTGSLAENHDGGQAVLLPNDTVLLAGGEGERGAALAAAEIYDPGTGRWSATGSLLTPRTDFTLTVLPSGLVLAAGGRNGKAVLSSAELYDPATGRWSPAGSLPGERASQQALALAAGALLVAGGYTGQGTPARTVDLFHAPRALAPDGPTLAAAAAPTGPVGRDNATRLYFEQTHHTLAGPFLSFWHAHLSGIVLAAPISEPVTLSGRTVQFLQRAVLLLDGQGQVSLLPLGRLLSGGRDLGPGPFDVAPIFKVYYDKHEGPVLFGRPISGVRFEPNGDGSGRIYSVQWFERGRLELHPELPPHYRVLPGLVGQETLDRITQSTAS